MLLMKDMKKRPSKVCRLVGSTMLYIQKLNSGFAFLEIRALISQMPECVHPEKILSTISPRKGRFSGLVHCHHQPLVLLLRQHQFLQHPLPLYHIPSDLGSPKADLLVLLLLLWLLHHFVDLCHLEQSVMDQLLTLHCPLFM